MLRSAAAVEGREGEGGVSDWIRNNAAPILSRDEKKNEEHVSG